MVKATFDLGQVNRTGVVRTQETDGLNMISKGLRAGKGPSIWKHRQEEDPTIRQVKELIKKGHFDMYKASSQDKGEIGAFAKSRKDMVILHDLVYRRVQLKDHDDATYQFAVPPKYRKWALKLVHNEFGHMGIYRTTSLMQDCFYWPHMAEDIRIYIQNCMRVH